MRRFAALAVLLGALLPALVAATDPRPSPELVITYPGNKQALLSSFKGKVVLLMFIQTTCPHCQSMVQWVSKLNTELGSKGFQPLAVAVNPMALMLVPDFIRDYHVNFPVGASERDPALSYLQINGAERWVVPQIVLIDKRGVIQKQSPPLGDEKLQDETNLRQLIEGLLQGSSPAKHASAKKHPA